MSVLCLCFIAKPKPGTLSNQVTTNDSKKETLRQPIRADSLVDYVARKISDQGGLKQEFEVSGVLLKPNAVAIDLDKELGIQRGRRTEGRRTKREKTERRKILDVFKA